MTLPISTAVEGRTIINALDALGLNITKEIGIINWKVARKTKSLIAKQVTKELSVTQKVVKAQLVARRNASRASLVGGTEQAAEVELKKSRRIPLRDFKARQTKKGVSYKISKSTGRKTIAGAFKGPRPGLTFVRFRGHVMQRVGSARLPIRKLYGPSPWGVHVINKQADVITPQINAELRRQMRERLRYQRLKKSGAI